MKLSAKINPKNIFRSKSHKKDSVSRSESSSFSSSITTSSASPERSKGATTPTTVLPTQPLTRSDLEALLRRITNDETEVKLMLDEAEINGEVDGIMTEFGEEEMRGAFDFFDSDGDGLITADELFQVFKVINGDDGCTLEECKRMIANVDLNGDGFVCFQDFARMMEQRHI
ncbi:Calcium-binding EF-hand [Artemisia annua]|uniref:Calcium-binding EF-hand n=1 Tax=Artemisia annua TaxID=35608 RepID=A0A2U1KPR8_ARTAN|nr:Calcium-binding EF-hand [Artemisia annua]